MELSNSMTHFQVTSKKHRFVCFSIWADELKISNYDSILIKVRGEIIAVLDCAEFSLQAV